MINDYFIQFEQTIADFSIIQKQKIEKQRKDFEFGIIKGKLFFENGSMEFIEVVRFVSRKFVKIKYKYHFMDNNNMMIFRYDNVKHHPHIKTFPHHKHVAEQILPSKEPDIFTVLKEIQKIIKTK